MKWQASVIPGGHIVDEECSVVRQENALPVDCRVFALYEEITLERIINELVNTAKGDNSTCFLHILEIRGHK
jgi:hypothetical protein